MERLTFAGFVQSEGDFELTANAQKLQIAPPPPLNSVQWAEIDGTFTLNSAEGGWIGGTGIAGKIIQRIDSTTTTTLYELPDIQNFKLYSYSKVEFESLNYAFDVGLLKFGAAEVAFLHDPPTIIPPYGGAFQLSIIGPYATVTDLFDEDNEDNEDKTWYFSDFDLDLSGPAGFDELIFSGDPLSLLGFKITPPEVTSPQINLVRTGNTLGLHLDGEMKNFAGTTFTVGRGYPVERRSQPDDEAHRKRISCTQPGRFPTQRRGELRIANQSAHRPGHAAHRPGACDRRDGLCGHDIYLGRVYRSRAAKPT